MKKLVFAVVGLAVVGVGSVVGTAMVGKSRVVAASNEAFQSLKGKDGLVRVVDYRYDGQLLSGVHTLRLGLGCEPEPGTTKDVTVTLRSRVKYGPLLGGGHFGAAQIDTSIEFPEEARQELTKVFGDQEPLHITTRVGYGNGVTSELVVPAVKYTDANKAGSLSWAGLTGDWVYDPASKNIKTSFAMPELRLDVAAKNQHVVLRGLKGQSQSVRPENAPWFLSLGEANADIDLIEVGTGDANSTLSLNKLHYTAKSELKDELLSSTATLTGAGKFGKLVLESVEFAESVKGVHVPTLTKIAQQVLDGNSMCKAAAGGTPVQPMNILADDKLRPLFFELARHDVEYGLDKLALKIDGKRGELSYRVALSGVKAEEKDAPLPELVKQHAKFSSKLALPLGWIDSAIKLTDAQGDPAQTRAVFESMIDSVAAQGLVVKDKDFVRAEFNMGPDGMQLNGKPFAPDALLRAGMGGGV